jgi:hypothetical protein
MHAVSRKSFLALCAFLLSAACVATAQGDPHHDRDRDHDRGPAQAQPMGHDEHHAAPAQAQQRYFRDNDRDRYYSHYRADADHWRGRPRPAFAPGQRIDRGYAIRPVPRSYWINNTPPPPGYSYGYYGGYVVVYSPKTRIIADVMDLVDAASHAH